MLTLTIILNRLFVASVLTFITYNPWEVFSVVKWLQTTDSKLSLLILVGIVCAAAHIAFFIASFKALSYLGTFITIGIAMAVAFVGYQYGFLDTRDTTIQVVALSIYSFFLGIGLSGAILWRKVTGQLNTI